MFENLAEVDYCECSAKCGHRLCCDCLKAALENDLHSSIANIKCIVDSNCTGEYSMEIL